MLNIVDIEDVEPSKKCRECKNTTDEIVYTTSFLKIEEEIVHTSSSLVPSTQSDTTTTPFFDIIIIGAGAIGCSIAREISKYNTKVLVLDRASDVAQGASKANSGIVHGGYDEKHGTLKSKLAIKGNMLFQQLDNELNFGFKRIGSLVIAYCKEEEYILHNLLENGKKNGVKDLRIIYTSEIRKLEPHISPTVHAALYCPSAGITSPYEYVQALSENAAENGVAFMLDREVTSIHTTDKGFSIDVNTGEVFESKLVINCAGLYSDRVAAHVGADNFTIKPRKGEYLLIGGREGSLVNTVLFPCPTAKGKGILVSPTVAGNLLLGPTSRDVKEKVSNKQVLEQIIKSSRRSVPNIDIGKTISSYSGLRAKNSRSDFIVEESQVKGFFNAAGIDSPGLTSSPAVAKMVVEMIRGKIHLAPNPTFNPYRTAIIKPKNNGFVGAIDHKDPEKNIICRCERVTEAEIVDSLNRIDRFAHLSPDSFHSTTNPSLSNEGLRVVPGTDLVKRRTRAGMGNCQGRFCEPRVAEVISKHYDIPVKMVPKRGQGSGILPHQRVGEDDRQFLKSIDPLESAKIKGKL